MENFTNKNVGAVISRVRVDQPKSMLERIQRFEYIMSSMTRKIMCNFGTLAITPGVLSLYNTKVLRKLDGFTRDETNITEDLEIALRLKFNGYDIKMEHESVTYTHVPKTFDALWRQRIRWARGYIHNHWDYRSMFFARKHGIFGMFQMPVNVFAVILLVLNIGIISYDLLNKFFDFVIRSTTIPNYFINRIMSIPTFKEFILARNVQIYLPIIVAFVVGVYLIVFAHRMFKERLSNQVAPLITYTLTMPYFSTMNWISSIYHEVRKTKRRW